VARHPVDGPAGPAGRLARRRRHLLRRSQRLLEGPDRRQDGVGHPGARRRHRWSPRPGQGRRALPRSGSALVGRESDRSDRTTVSWAPLRDCGKRPSLVRMSPRAVTDERGAMVRGWKRAWSSWVAWPDSISRGRSTAPRNWPWGGSSRVCRNRPERRGGLSRVALLRSLLGEPERAAYASFQNGR